MDHNQEGSSHRGVEFFNHMNPSHFRGDFFPGHPPPANYFPLPNYSSVTDHSTVPEIQEPIKVVPLPTSNNIEQPPALSHSEEASIDVNPNSNKSVKKTPKKVKVPVTRKNLTFVCDFCNKIFGTRQNRDRHVLTHNGGNLFNCEDCGRKFSKQRSLTRHRVIHISNSKTNHVKGDDEEKFTCDECGRQFAEKRYLLRHRRVIHNTNRSPDKSVSLDSTISKTGKPKRVMTNPKFNDVRNPSSEKFTCEECGLQFAEKRYLRRHRRLIHNPNRIIPERLRCDKCDQTFSQKFYLTRHLKLHTGSLPFGCPTCGKHFADKTYLNQHLKVHDKKFRCDQCGKHFGFIAGLRLHYKVHTGEKTHTCEYCAKQFRFRPSLIRHVKSLHTNDKPFKCDECDKSYTDQFLLNAHKKSCHGEDPAFACKECGKCFSSNSRIQAHMRIHNGEKPYECSDCGKKFSDRGNFLRHRKIHSREKKIYSCEFEGCEKTFSQKLNFTRHTERHKRNELTKANLEVKSLTESGNRTTRSKANKLAELKNDQDKKINSSKRKFTSSRKQRQPRSAVIKPRDNRGEESGSNYSAESDVEDDGGSWSDGSESEIVIKKVASLSLVSKQIDQKLYKKFLGDTKLPWVVLERVSTLTKGVSTRQVSRTRSRASNHLSKGVSRRRVSRTSSGASNQIPNYIDDENMEVPVSPEEGEVSWEPSNDWNNNSDSEMEIEVEKISRCKSDEERVVSDENNVKFIINLVKKKSSSNSKNETSSKSPNRSSKKPKQSTDTLVKKRKRKAESLPKKPRKKSLNTIKNKKNSKRKDEDADKETSSNEKTSWNCNECGRVFNQKRYLTLHQRKQHLTIKKCLECDIVFADRGKLTRHRRRHHRDPTLPEQIFACEHCNRIFKGKQNWERHVATHSDTYTKPFTCELCGATFTRQDTKRYHVLRCHTEETDNIVVARERGERPPGLRRRRIFPCKVCSKTFATKSQLISHSWRLHNPNKQSERQNSLNESEEPVTSTTSATAETPIDAQMEKDNYNQQYQGPPMMNMHPFNDLLHIPQGSSALAPPENHGYPRYEQEYVPEYHNYQWIDTTTNQRAMSDGNCTEILRPPVIENGAEQSTRKQNFETGIVRNIKSGDYGVTRSKPPKKHICPICDKVFKQVCHLKQHMPTHTGEKNHQCEHCLKRFSLKGNLQQHIRDMHSGGENSFLCDLCGSKLSSATYLKFHLETHTAEFAGMKTAILKDIDTQKIDTNSVVSKDKDDSSAENNLLVLSLPKDDIVTAADVNENNQSSTVTVVPEVKVDVSAASSHPDDPDSN